jgi:hypothetical protein
MELTDINFSRFGLNWSIESPVAESCDVIFTFNNATEGGSTQPMQLTLTNQGLGTTSGYTEFTDVLFDLSQSSNPTAPPYNNMSVAVEVVAPASVMAGETFNVSLFLDTTAVEQTLGYFGQRDIEIPTTDFSIDLGGIEEFVQGFTLTDPSIKLEMYNSIGISMGMDARLNGLNTTGDIVTLDFPDISISQPAAPGNTTQTDIVIDRNTSNIVDFLAIVPSQFILSGDVGLNPNNTGATQNFIDINGDLVGSLELELPLEIQSSNLLFEEELEVELFDDDAVDAVDFFDLVIGANNGFPLGLQFTIDFLDAAGNTLDQVVIPIMDAADVDGNGRVTSKKSSTTETSFTTSQIQNMIAAEKWLLQGRLETSNGGTVPVKFYSDYEVDFTMGFRSRFDVSQL